jgi:CMP-N,N'-diacetyllegionaminic acid synthase
MRIPTCVALVPARYGSKRVPGKNIRLLAGHPLIAYTLAAAKQSGIFKEIVVSTDSEKIADVALYYGAQVPFLRPVQYATDTSPDIEWITHALVELGQLGRRYDCYCILRPTSPFRQATTIQRAWQSFLADGNVDSLRAVEKCSQHPGKMWVVRGKRLLPLLPFGDGDRPWHSLPYQALPEIYVQNASMEIAWTRVVFESRTISGETVVPFFTDDMEGFDINNEYDWHIAEQLIRTGRAELPIVVHPPYEGTRAA